MKIVLLKTKDNKHFKGWDIIPENSSEKEILGCIRDLIFWGFDDSKPKYDGMESEIIKKDGKELRYVTKLMWRIKKYNR